MPAVGEAGGELADHAGDVEEGREGEVGGALGDRVAGDLADGVVRERAVRVHGALGGAAGAGGVADEGGVGGGEVRIVRRGVALAGHGREVGGRRPRRPGRGVRGGVRRGGGRRARQGVRRPARIRYGGRGEEPRVVTGLEIPVAGGQGDAYVRTARGLAHVPRPRPAVADQRGGAGVAQDVPDLAGLVHRVERDDDGPGLPGGEDGEHEVRGVLQHDGDPVPAADAVRREVVGDGVGQRVGLGVVGAAVEIGERGALGGPGHGLPEEVQHGRRRRDGRALGRAEQPEPGPGGVRGAHRVSHFCWMWFIPLSQRSGSVARAA